jgi:hypothetical protein
MTPWPGNAKSNLRKGRSLPCLTPCVNNVGSDYPFPLSPGVLAVVLLLWSYILPVKTVGRRVLACVNSLCVFKKYLVCGKERCGSYKLIVPDRIDNSVHPVQKSKRAGFS